MPVPLGVPLLIPNPAFLSVVSPVPLSVPVTAHAPVHCGSAVLGLTFAFTRDYGHVCACVCDLLCLSLFMHMFVCTETCPHNIFISICSVSELCVDEVHVEAEPSITENIQVRRGHDQELVCSFFCGEVQPFSEHTWRNGADERITNSSKYRIFNVPSNYKNKPTKEILKVINFNRSENFTCSLTQYSNKSSSHTFRLVLEGKILYSCIIEDTKLFFSFCEVTSIFRHHEVLVFLCCS